MYNLQGLIPMQMPVRVNQDATGVLTPSFGGQGTAYITIQQGEGPKTAVISFFGMNQALVSFDSLGMKGINYTCLHGGVTAVDCKSIENIIHHMNENMLG